MVEMQSVREPEYQAWYEDHIAYDDGTLVRWCLNIYGLGHIRIDRAVDPRLIKRFGTDDGWYLSGIPSFGRYFINTKLKARSLEGAKLEALDVVRKFLKKTLQELP